MPNPTPHAPETPLLSTFAADFYVQQTLELLGLKVPPVKLPNVVEHFERVRTIAQPVLDFPLPDDLESAPTFEP